MQTEPEKWAVEAWERYGPMIFNCEITGPEVLQLVVEERERKLRDRHLADLGEALDHMLQDVELEDALTAVGIGVYGPDATKFEKMFAAAMKCRARFVALATRQDAPVTENSHDQ